MRIWYNPECSKCAIAQAALDEAGVEYTLRDYLAEPPNVEELAEVVEKLGGHPREITRFHELAAEELQLTPESDIPVADWLAILAKHPELIQRPIMLLDDGSALIARDSATVKKLVTVTTGQ
ncbi:MAG: arsenate reductase family protein [Corynebacteriales bacterium]|nr:arsenate reductase family protein [Mycobacteriales bacterium]